MAVPIHKRIAALLEAIKEDHPRRRQEAEELLKPLGITEGLDLRVLPPERAGELPTFDWKIFRPMTPMLRARFELAGSWQDGPTVWLAPSEMARYMGRRWVRSSHRALREHYEGSAPMRFPDNRLTLFGSTTHESEDLTYLVWAQDGQEPEVWEYVQSVYEFRQFTNLEKYFEWCLERL